MTDIDVNDDTIIGTPAQSLPIGGRMRYRIFVEPVQSLPASVVERVRSGQIVTASASGLAQNFYCDLLDIADRHLSPGASKALARVACGQAGHMDRQRLAGLGTVLNAKRDAHAFAAHFAPLLKEFGVSCRDYVDTGYVRVALPSDDMTRAGAAVGSPIPSETSLDEQVACDIAQPPHRDLAVPHRHFEINFWFRLGPDGVADCVSGPPCGSARPPPHCSPTHDFSIQRMFWRRASQATTCSPFTLSTYMRRPWTREAGHD